MEDLAKSMEAIMSRMKADLQNVESNKAAAARVRKDSLEFAKVAKDFRKESVAFHKK